MCDGYVASKLIVEENQKGGKMDIDKETVQVVAVIGGVVIAVAALVFDGDLGYAMGTGIMTLASGAVGYIFGSKKCEGAAP